MTADKGNTIGQHVYGLALVEGVPLDPAEAARYIKMAPD